jgi:hypothetical protein
MFKLDGGETDGETGGETDTDREPTTPAGATPPV